MKAFPSSRRVPWGIQLIPVLALSLGSTTALWGVCGPFSDAAADSFCPFVLEIFYLGITTGTTPTTYDPEGNVSRLQMAAFLSRSVDGVLKRGSRRAALNQHWTTQGQPPSSLIVTTVGAGPTMVQSDGADLWVANTGANTVSRVRASDGKQLETWTGAVFPQGVLVALGRVFVAGTNSPGRLYMIDPAQPAGVVTTVASNLAGQPTGITFDGARIWTANQGDPTGVSIVTPGAGIPWTVTTVAIGSQSLFGALYDGANVWVSRGSPGSLLKLSGSGAILQTVTVGTIPQLPVFDGHNIWVPNGGSDSVSVIRASNGVVLGTLTGNGLSVPLNAAFDGERVLVTNEGIDSVSLWKAANLTPLGSFPMGTNTDPFGACSDGLNFWVTLNGSAKLARF
jgi:DNA-binding beta-propeller fold protein YncE